MRMNIVFSHFTFFSYIKKEEWIAKLPEKQTKIRMFHYILVLYVVMNSKITILIKSS